jgi:hypothetical protein
VILALAFNLAQVRQILFQILVKASAYFHPPAADFLDARTISLHRHSPRVEVVAANFRHVAAGGVFIRWQSISVASRVRR